MTGCQFLAYAGADRLAGELAIVNYRRRASDVAAMALPVSEASLFFYSILSPLPTSAEPYNRDGLKLLLCPLRSPQPFTAVVVL